MLLDLTCSVILNNQDIFSGSLKDTAHAHKTRTFLNVISKHMWYNSDVGKKTHVLRQHLMELLVYAAYCTLSHLNIAVTRQHYVHGAADISSMTTQTRVTLKQHVTHARDTLSPPALQSHLMPDRKHCICIGPILIGN